MPMTRFLLSEIQLPISLAVEDPLQAPCKPRVSWGKPAMQMTKSKDSAQG